MCGIAGIITHGRISQADVELIERMNEIQKHRGPDDFGVYSDHKCALGHRRLAVIDLTEDGRQPFESDDKCLKLVYNGEIYNYLELRDELEQKGWRFRTKTDTEVLLKAYQQYGEKCLSKFNGMFAFAIYDTVHQSLFLARDRVGIKPLYYAEFGSKFYFASEIKALRVIPCMTASVNYQSLFDYLVFNRTDVHDETFHSDIKRIPKGCFATFDRKGLQIRQWWSAQGSLNTASDFSLKEIVDKIRDLVISSVQLRMRSDVPVGSCLSGGLDSSILIGVLFNHCKVPDRYPTFTASFPGQRVDETKYVENLNRVYPFRSFRTFPNANTARSQLRDFVYVNDEPTTSPSFYSQYEVMRLAKKRGVTVLLDGQGGDENFAGYHYFHGFNLYGQLVNRNFLKFTSELSKSLMRKQHISVYQTLLFQVLPFSTRKKLLLKMVPYVQPDFYYRYIEESRIYKEFFDVDGLNQSLVRHFQYKLEHLLRMEDRNSMAFSLEARVPYLDYRLVEYLLSLPDRYKIRNGETKYLQKQALGKYTVPTILNRRDKIGFGTPGEKWMMSETWKGLTFEGYQNLTEAFPEIFIKDAQLPEKGFDRWKINQLATWRSIFMN